MWKWAAHSWLVRLNAMYRERRRLGFLGADHLNIVADPATHSKHDTMASIVWSWQTGIAAHGDLQYIPHGGMLSSEQEMPEHIARLYCERRLERLAAFRQIQALSNTIKQLGMWSGIDDFTVPAEYRIDAVEAGEVRVLAPAQDHGPDSRNYAVRVRPEEGTVHRVLPDSAFVPSQSYKLLVVSLDQGGVGAAGVVFAQEQMRMMIFAHWDKFHRVIRDINLALGRCANGLFLKTRIFSAHLWSLNYKPWGTGLFGTQKRQLLNSFMATQSPASPVFRRYAPRIAEALGRSLDTPEDYTSLFDDLPFIARSFQLALNVVKMGRWFSWNDCARVQLPEFFIQKMLLEHHLDAGPCASAGQDAKIQDPDDGEAAFDDLKGAARANTPTGPTRTDESCQRGLPPCIPADVIRAVRLQQGALYSVAALMESVCGSVRDG